MIPMHRRDPFDDIFRGFLVRPVDVGNANETPELKLDVREQEHQYLVHAEIAGVNKEDIHVHIDGAVVAISAERHQEIDIKEGERVLRSERYFGKVSRSFQLAQEVDEAHASAKYADGVLELVLPKKAAAQAKRLMVN